jgi:hypothetical protein
LATVHATAAMEQMMRVPLATIVAAAAWPAMTQPGRAAREFEALRFYEPLAHAGDVSRVFLPPPKGIRIEARPRAASSVRPEIRRLDLRFDSPFEPLNPAAAPQYARMTRNAVSHAQYWCHGDGPRPTLIVIHGFGADAPSLNARVLGLPWPLSPRLRHPALYLPAPRTAGGTGRLVQRPRRVRPRLIHFNEVALHAIHDLRVFIDYLRGRGVEHIGVTGISLGGYTASLLATVEERSRLLHPDHSGREPDRRVSRMAAHGHAALATDAQPGCRRRRDARPGRGSQPASPTRR